VIWIIDTLRSSSFAPFPLLNVRLGRSAMIHAHRRPEDIAGLDAIASSDRSARKAASFA
jgi:hypothetical protein